MNLIKYTLPIFFLSGSAFSEELCAQLYNKLNSENNSQSIIQNVLFYYSVFGRRNYNMGVEYKYNIDSSNNESRIEHYTELNEDDLISEYNFNSNSTSSSNISGKLKDCNNNGNSATFSIKMVHPGLKSYTKATQPTFNLYFMKRSNGWSISYISSPDFIDLYHEHLVHSYKNYARYNNGSFSDDFYTVSLKNMVINEIFPALKNKLESEFNLKIQNFN